jgi:hypothetical protein
MSGFALSYVLSCTAEEIRAMKPEIRDWWLDKIKSELGFEVSRPVVDNAKPEAPGLSHDDVKAAAVSLAERKGTDAVLSILKNMGIRRVADCPKDRLSELLEAIQGA